MSQLDTTIYTDLILMFLFFSFFLGVLWVFYFDTLINWGVLIKFFWLEFICDLKLLICSYLMTLACFGNKVLKLNLLGNYFKKKNTLLKS